MVYDFAGQACNDTGQLSARQGKWLYTDYDSLNRPVLTGLWTSPPTGLPTSFLPITALLTRYLPQIIRYLHKLIMTDYTWVSSSGSGLSSSMITTYNNNATYFYTADNSTFPYPQCSSCH